MQTSPRTEDVKHSDGLKKFDDHGRPVDANQATEVKGNPGSVPKLHSGELFSNYS